METVLIVDDHEIVRCGIISLIEEMRGAYEIIEAGTCAEVIRIFESREIRYAVLDLSLVDGNLFSPTYDLSVFSEKTRMLVYSMNEEGIYARRLLQKGIRGFVSKQSSMEELKQAIQTVLKGEIYASNNLMESLFNPLAMDAPTNPIHQLSDRELEVVELLVMGLGTKEIANKLDLDMTTISTYRKRAYEKLNVQNLIEMKDVFQWYKRAAE